MIINHKINQYPNKSMESNNKHYIEIAKESLNIFNEISDIAQQKLRNTKGHKDESSFATINSFNNVAAVNKMHSISKSNIDAYEKLIEEPAIWRISVIDDDGKTCIYYISRNASLPLTGDIKLASYRSPIGRLASIPIGDEVSLFINGVEHLFEIHKKTKYKPNKIKDEWDSRPSIFEEFEEEPVTIKSLLELFRETLDDYDEEEFDRLINVNRDNIQQGIQYEVRSAMSLRDQPTLDQFQDEIFRLPINNQLIIIGPPGTGKTTTLIRRLGQKLDNDALDANENNLVDNLKSQPLVHGQSWVMFTPTDLLKHYVKEAFNREQVPASEERIKTWLSYQIDLARYTLKILQAEGRRGLILKPKLYAITNHVEESPIEWFEAFQKFHNQRIYTNFCKALEVLEKLRDDDNTILVDKLYEIVAEIDETSLLSIYRDLDKLAVELSFSLTSLKEQSDKLIKDSLGKIFKKDKEILNSLALFLDSIQSQDDLDDEEEFEDESTEEVATTDAIQKAFKIYSQTIRSLASYQYSNRKPPKESRTQKIRDWLGERMPDDKLLLMIGKLVANQNGLRRFINTNNRYVSEVPKSYEEFRKKEFKQKNWYKSDTLENQKHVGMMELDAIILLMLKNTRELMKQFTFTNSGLINSISAEFRNQVLVDEATDFSPIQLACMYALTNLETKSFFACGDFNQRITSYGTRTPSQFQWVVDGIDLRTINTVYRQSKKLNEFSLNLIKTLDGDIESSGQLPKNLNHNGVLPALIENCDSTEKISDWLKMRILEVEKISGIGKMPTVAVLVNSEDEVGPISTLLNTKLENKNLRVVPCFGGQSLGHNNDIRVFDIKHIKGLEFEAVFFVDVDVFESNHPDLFAKYLYVGATRAATFFGLTCKQTLPETLKPLAQYFSSSFVD